MDILSALYDVLTIDKNFDYMSNNKSCLISFGISLIDTLDIKFSFQTLLNKISI